MDIRLTGIFGKRRHWNGLDGRFTRPLANVLFQLEQEALVLILLAAQLDPHNIRIPSS
jgi:non-ribosomal peptide synthetase component F